MSLCINDDDEKDSIGCSLSLSRSRFFVHALSIYQLTKYDCYKGMTKLPGKVDMSNETGASLECN